MRKIRLDQYDLRQLLRTPAIELIIVDELRAIPGQDLLSIAIRRGAVDSLQDCLKMIVGGYQDNPDMLTRIVGIDLLRKIEQYTGQNFVKNQNSIT